MRKLFNNSWKFAMTPASSSISDIDKLDFKPVDIPHDWLIADSNDLYKTSFGFYRKSYTYSGAGSVRLYFEGVYQDCTVYINGKEAGENKYGYSSFEVDITPLLNDGCNDIVVLVRHEAPNSRWYSGAGIYRNIHIIKTGADYLATDGIYFTTKKDGDVWKCTVSAEVVGSGELLYSLKDRSGNILYLGENSEFTVKDAPVWDIDSPNLLKLTVSLKKDGEIIDKISQKVGLRTIEFKPESGFFLNGRHVKLHGVCLHHDLGPLGAAFNKEVARRQLLSMKEMGANAVRTSHNMPAIGFMELCDELGILVDSEAFDMWERPKTEFDYARFFHEWFEKDVASWVRRDRNHPSVIMWSVGNEIYDTHHSDRGRQVAAMLHSAVRKHDPMCNAFTTIGSNYMPWEGAQNCAKEVDLAGYNYGEKLYKLHREQHPEWKIYGSETTAGVKSRGVYHFPLGTPFLTHEDLQCSSLGNCRGGISAPTPQQTIAADRDTDFCAGMFIWTGSDYIGEPSPYSTKNSYYGPIDTAGLKKDSFYLYKSAWTDEPVLHLLPYWDFNEGQCVDVVAYTNQPEVELFVNGISVGKKTPTEYTVSWQIPYTKGEIKAVAGELCDVRKSFGDAVSLVLSPSHHGKKELYANGEDVIAVKITALDKDGNSVSNARNRVKLSVEGARLIGFDNGDSTDYDSYKANERKLFSGAAVVMIAASDKVGKAVIKAESEGLSPAVLEINVLPADVKEGVAFSENITSAPENHEIPVRKIALTRTGGMLLTPESSSIDITAEILPHNATYSDLKWSVVTNSGIVTNLAEVSANGNSARLTALGDGEFRLRCTCANGKPQAEVISDFEFTAEGFGQPFTDPYSFVTGCFYNVSKGVMSEVSEGGISMTKEQDTVGYTKVNFGKYGTNELTVRFLHWFTNDPVSFSLFNGDPDNGGKLIGEFTYQADFLWQTYKENTFTLPERLCGEQDIFLKFGDHVQRLDLGGFRFTPNEKAYQRIAAADCDLVHGDTFEENNGRIERIGNNVFFDFEDMDFTRGVAAVRLTGRTRHDNDTIHVVAAGDFGEVKEIVEFPYSEDYITVEKEFPDISGMSVVKLQFLPGCDFDLDSIEFVPKN